MTHWDRELNSMNHGRNLASPGRFTNDDGSPEQPIRSAGDAGQLVEAMRAGRVIVAVVAVADQVEEVDGLTKDKSSDMSVVSMFAADGRRALLAFTGLDALLAWNPNARPVPVSGVDAARAAIEDGCEAIVLDVAGPGMQVIPEVDLLTLAGVDPLDHARRVTDQVLQDALGSTNFDVSVVGARLRVRCEDATIDGSTIASAITPRILALVPDGVEVQQA